MTHRSAALLTGLLMACAVPKAPYDDLKVDSYGPLVKYQDARMRTVGNPPPCDPDLAPRGSAVGDLSFDITQVLMKPLAGMGVHETIKADDLEDQFRVPGDLGLSPVVVLESDADHILFWHVTDIVPVAETMAAAQKFCRRHGETALYRGTARRCGPPQAMPVVVNGKRTMTSTYGISDFQCLPSSSPRRQSLPGR